MTSNVPGQLTMSVQGYGLCTEDDDYAQSLGFSDCKIDAVVLPPMIRRRTSRATRMAITALAKACESARVSTDLPVIFASSVGEMSVTNQLCLAIAALEFPLSPTLFHNSVHNSAAGYWSIAMNSMSPMQSMAGLEDSFALGLLEAFCQIDDGSECVLMVCYDESMPEYLLNDYNWHACAVAFVLGRPETDKPMISRPFQSNSYTSHGKKFQDLNPVCNGIRLLQQMHTPETKVKRVCVSAGNSRWHVNLKSPGK